MYNHLQIQWGLEYRTRSDFEWLSMFGSWPRPFENRTFKMAALGQVVLYKNNFLFIYIKRPSLEPKFGFRMVRTIRKRNKMAAILFFNIRKRNKKRFGFRMVSDFECSVLEPPLYPFSPHLIGLLCISTSERMGNIQKS